MAEDPHQEAINLLTYRINSLTTELTAARAKIERIDLSGIHTCHDKCQRWTCVLMRENKMLTEQRDGLRSAVDYASDQLTRVTEQRDAVTLRLGDTQVLMFDAEKQRDRLAEALKDALYDLETSDGLMACDNEEGHSLFCLEQRSIPKARQAIQSLNQAAVKGGNHES